jgi:preprotein translocase subunit SecE
MAEEKLTTTTQAGWMDQSRDFVKDVRVEFGRVSWPTREELRDSTLVVIVMVLLVSAYLFVWDRIFAFVMRLLFAGGA